MKVYSLRLAGLLTGLALVIFFSATPSLKADEWNLETRIVANHDIEVPGAVLQANTPYYIKLMDSPNDRKVVQVFNEREDHLMSTFIAVSAERLNPVDKPTFDFMEVPAGHPAPVQTWFHPGRRIGLEFLYPKAQMDKFASYWNTERTRQTAQAAPPAEAPAVIAETPAAAPANDQLATAEQDALNPEQTAAADQKLDSVEINRAKPTETESEPVQIAQNTDTTPQRENTSRSELPHTAGELQLLGLVGALCATLGAIRIRR